MKSTGSYWILLSRKADPVCIRFEVRKHLLTPMKIDQYLNLSFIRITVTWISSKSNSPSAYYNGQNTARLAFLLLSLISQFPRSSPLQLLSRYQRASKLGEQAQVGNTSKEEKRNTNYWSGRFALSVLFWLLSSATADHIRRFRQMEFLSNLVEEKKKKKTGENAFKIFQPKQTKK